MRTGKRRRRLEKLAFFVPFLVILLAVIYVLGVNALKGPGQIVVTAETSGRYFAARPLHVDATVGGTLGTTPFNLSLNEGTYTVQYANLPWFVTPAPRVLTVLNGVPVYAIGKYDPVVRSIAVTQTAFNTTSVAALHATTPVVWVNTSNMFVLLNINPVGRVVINAGQNFTYVFSQAGTFSFGFYFGGVEGSVVVS